VSAVAPLEQTEDPRDCWRTPDGLFVPLNDRWSLDVDAAADQENAKLRRFWDREDNGIAQLENPLNDHLRVWCNPPYSDIEPWVRALFQRTLRGAFAIALLPANRTQLAWFHDYALRAEIWWFKGRIRFLPPPGVDESTPRGNNMLVVFDPATLDAGIHRSACPRTGALL
jgi:phage N-6-adenine-methyltransferase